MLKDPECLSQTMFALHCPVFAVKLFGYRILANVVDMCGVMGLAGK
jgi:hypothetical protein